MVGFLSYGVCLFHSDLDFDRRWSALHNERRRRPKVEEKGRVLLVGTKRRLHEGGDEVCALLLLKINVAVVLIKHPRIKSHLLPQISQIIGQAAHQQTATSIVGYRSV
jgi:hypothetical protein